MATDNPCKFKTPPFRGSFVNLKRARAYGDKGAEKFSITGLLPQDHKWFGKLQDCIDAAATKRFDKVPARLKSPIRDGDEMEYEGWEGQNFFQMLSDERPGILKLTEEGEIEKLDDIGECYSGAWYKATGRAWAWEYKGKKGVSLQLDNVLLIPTPEGEDDSSFSGKASAEEDFADEVDEEDDDALS